MNWSWMARIGGSRTVIAAAVAISVLLMGATVFVQQTIHEASDLVVQGMGGMLLRSVNEGIRRWDARSGPHTVANRTILERLLRRHIDDGLRYIAIVDDEARVIVEAGSPSLQGLPADRRSVLRKRGRVRLVRQVPPLRILDIEASLADEPPEPRYTRRQRNPINSYFVVFEFEPVAAQDLERRGGTVLIAAVVASLGILGLAWLFALALRARERLSAELEQKRRLATLGEMSAVLAHELRNPLASLKGHAQLLAEYLEADPQLASKAHRVVGDAVRLENRMNDLLTFVRTGELERFPAHPDQPLKGAVAALGAGMVDVIYLDGSDSGVGMESGESSESGEYTGPEAELEPEMYPESGGYIGSGTYAEAEEYPKSGGFIGLGDSTGSGERSDLREHADSWDRSEEAFAAEGLHTRKPGAERRGTDHFGEGGFDSGELGAEALSGLAFKLEAAEERRAAPQTHRQDDSQGHAQLAQHPASPTHSLAALPQPQLPQKNPHAKQSHPLAALDSARLQQALENVLLNAAQANPPEKKVLASISSDNGKLRYQIRDFGPGIPPAELSQIFEPFVTTRTRGVGLGLAVTRRIVEAHGGSVYAENMADGGALFTLEIPYEPQTPH